MLIAIKGNSLVNCSLPDGVYELYEQGSKVTTPQHKYYRGVVLTTISDYSGYYVEEVHNLMKLKFLREYVNGYRTVKSTGDLSKKDMQTYIDKIIQRAAQYGVEIPSSDFSH